MCYPTIYMVLKITAVPLVLHRPQEKKKEADSWNKSTTGSTSTSVFFLYDIPYFCHDSSLTAYPKVPPPCDGLFGALTTVWQRGSSFRAL